MNLSLFFPLFALGVFLAKDFVKEDEKNEIDDSSDGSFGGYF